MHILKNNKITLYVHGVTGTHSSSMIQYNYINLCDCTSIYAKKVCICGGGITKKYHNVFKYFNVKIIYL